MIIAGFDFGLMKKHEENAAKGDLFTSGGEEFEKVKEEDISSNGKVIDLLLPVIVLIGSAIGAMVYTGFLGGATDVVSAFAGCDAETSLILQPWSRSLSCCFCIFRERWLRLKDSWRVLWKALS